MRENLHSRIVTWLKVILPTAALGILSTIFFISSGLNPDGAIPFADVDVEELTREQRISEPSYAGVTRDGTAVTFSAAQAVPEPGNPTRAALSRLEARMETVRGDIYNAEAATGVIDSTAQTIQLDGGIRLTTSRGVNVEGQSLQGSLEDTRVTVQGPVNATAPFGTLNAGQMELTRAEGQDDNYLMVFQDRVRIVYNPAVQRRE